MLFGLAPSPFLLAGVIEQHLNSWDERYPNIIAELGKSLYVDDLLTGGQTIPQAEDRKEKTVEIFEDASFKLHKWNSNVSELEVNGEPSAGNDEETYAKQQLGGDSTDTRMLGLKWNKSSDTLTVSFPTVDSVSTTTKRTILSKLAKVYDPLGVDLLQVSFIVISIHNSVHYMTFVGTCLQLISGCWFILDTRLATNWRYCPSPRIQWRATALSSHPYIVGSGRFWSAFWTFFTRLVAMCADINSRRGIVSPR